MTDIDIPPTHRAEVTGVQISVLCPCCNTQQTETVDLAQCTGPGWEVEMEHRWRECDACGALLDVGFGCDMEAME